LFARIPSPPLLLLIPPLHPNLSFDESPWESNFFHRPPVAGHAGRPVFGVKIWFKSTLVSAFFFGMLVLKPLLFFPLFSGFGNIRRE